MSALAHERNHLLLVPLAALGALALGAMIGRSPQMAVALAGFAIVMALPWLLPVTHLMLLLFVTAIIPFSTQNSISAGSAGLIPSDLLLIGGLVRAAIVLVREPLERHQRIAVGAMLVFLLVSFVAFVRGWRAGQTLSDVGAEFRVLLGFGTLLIAIPLLNDDAARRRLLRGLLVLAIVMGLWGLVQFFGGVSFSETEDSGLRQGVEHTTTGRGQVQGGLFAFPVAATIGFAALMSAHARTLRLRLALIAVVSLNLVSMLLTYERTFWVATVLAFALVAFRAGRLERLKAVIAAPALVLVLFAVLATVAPNELTAARERLLSLSQYSSDNSVRYRIVETRAVTKAIKENPVFGHGLAATVWWGRPWEQIPPYSSGYAHNGYVWLAWKLGIPVALLFVALLIRAATLRAPPRGGPLFAGVRNGAQAGVLIVLIATVTFPSVSTLAVTSFFGVVLALCFAAPARRATPPGSARRGAASARVRPPRRPEPGPAVA